MFLCWIGLLVFCGPIVGFTSCGLYRHKFTISRKDKLSPPYNTSFVCRQRRSILFCPAFSGTLTVETALVLPIFLFFMIAALQYGAVMETAVKFGTSLSETGKAMATAAYVSEYGGESSGGTDLVVGALSAIYAQHRVLSEAGDTSSVKNANMALSSFLGEDEEIDLILTYQIRSPIAGIRLPGQFFLQRAWVRAWTGRTGGRKADEEGDGESGDDYVYVTATGGVCHEDPDCTYLKLSIREVDRSSLETLRNSGGGIYHACERCGGGSGSSVYITKDGNRYHSSLTCSGLKRTVKQVRRDECTLRACSKCGKHSG